MPGRLIRRAPARFATTATIAALTAGTVGIAVGAPAGAAETLTPVARIDFTNQTAPVAPGYTADFGEAFSSARGFGWVEQATSTPLSLVGNGRDRGVVTDQRIDSLLHMQLADATTDQSVGVLKPGRWEMLLPNGTYQVTVGVGDVSVTAAPSRNVIKLEGVSVIDGFVPTAAQPTTQATARAVVKDSRLTVGALGGTNTKITFLDIDRVSGTPDPTTTTTSTTVAPTTTTTSTLPPVVEPADQPWAASSAYNALGIYVEGGKSGIDAHEDWLGRDVKYRLVFAGWGEWDTTRASFSRLTDPATGYLKGNDRTLIVAMGLTMKEGSSGSKEAQAKLEAAAAGANDAFWTSIGQTLHSRGLDGRYPDGRPKVVLRVGWEHNGTWYPWSSKGREELFAAAWRRAHDMVELNAPDAVWAWGLSPNNSTEAAVARSYPGDDYVDVIEMDLYDSWGAYPTLGGDADPSRRPVTWTKKLTGTMGLNFLSSFAAQHDKYLSLTEWGLWRQVKGSYGETGGGDNADYIVNVTNWLDEQARAGRLAWANYFEVDTTGPAHSLRAPDAPALSAEGSQYPLGAAKFLDLYGGSAPT